MDKSCGYCSKEVDTSGTATNGRTITNPGEHVSIACDFGFDPVLYCNDNCYTNQLDRWEEIQNDGYNFHKGG